MRGARLLRHLCSCRGGVSLRRLGAEHGVWEGGTQGSTLRPQCYEAAPPQQSACERLLRCLRRVWGRRGGASLRRLYAEQGAWAGGALRSTLRPQCYKAAPPPQSACERLLRCLRRVWSCREGGSLRLLADGAGSVVGRGAA